MRLRNRYAMLLFMGLLAMPGAVRAHGGEEHTHDEATAPPAAVAGMQGEVLTSSATTDYFEVVAKYPATDAGEDTRVRLFIADFATNAPIANAGLDLSFRPRGVVVREPARMVSPGIYDVVLRFPNDTIYALVATVTAGQRTDFVEVRNLYAGDAADRFLAEHGPAATSDPVATESRSWLVPALIAGAVALIALVLIVVRSRRRSTASTDTSVARDPELSAEPTKKP
jgi:hypothetical protein